MPFHFRAVSGQVTGGLLEEVQNLKFKDSLTFLRWGDFFCKKKTRDLSLLVAPSRIFFPRCNYDFVFQWKDTGRDLASINDAGSETTVLWPALCPFFEGSSNPTICRSRCSKQPPWILCIAPMLFFLSFATIGCKLQLLLENLSLAIRHKHVWLIRYSQLILLSLSQTRDSIRNFWIPDDYSVISSSLFCCFDQ